jgi:hypothetical protein
MKLPTRHPRLSPPRWARHRLAACIACFTAVGARLAAVVAVVTASAPLIGVGG